MAKKSKRKYRESFLLLILLLSNSAFSQSRDFTAIDEWLKSNTGDMGGRAVLMIYKEGRIIYSNAVNDMNWRQKMAAKMFVRRQGKSTDIKNYTDTTQQPIASCSKWLSAALVMTFVDEGRLKITDSVGSFLPILSLHGKGAITISQCLSHTTGIKAPSLKESLNGLKSVTSMKEEIEHIALLPMEGEPGKVFHYSNVGLQIAGAVIERISGKNFKSLFAERLAGPLNMTQSDFGETTVPLPAGSGRSTAQDYMNFLEMILNKGVFHGKRILSEQSISEMQVNRITPDIAIAYSPAEAGGEGYGFGEWVMKNSSPNDSSRFFSSPGLFGSFPWVDNEKRYCAFLMTFYLKSKGRNDRYNELKSLVDKAVE